MKFKKTAIILSAILFIALFAGYGIYNNFRTWSETPAGTDTTKIPFLVKPGQGFQLTARQLFQRGIISNPVKFRWLARLCKQDTKIKAGEYLLSASMPPLKILSTLAEGKVRLYRVTIPEGFDLKQIADAVAKAGFGTKEAFLKAAGNPMLLAQRNVAAETFEGYLFPDTYFFPKGTNSNDIIMAMEKRMRSVFSLEWQHQAKKLGMDMHKILTLASIIEKETGDLSEMGLISSVFHNRLKKKMRLESDPTVIYGIKDFNGNIQRKHLQAYTPYNTYKIKGLPPGPIANPGKAAIKAALFPETTDYLFFVSRKDTTHQFSTNIKDHNRAVRKYQLRRRRN